MKLVKANALMGWSKLKESRELCTQEHLDYNLERNPSLPRKLVYVSHRWITKEHPDPDGIQLSELKHRLRILYGHNGGLDDAWVFFDYCSLPQRPRTDQEDIEFLRDLKTLRNISCCSENVIILSEGYTDYKYRTWCFFELLVAEGNLHLFEDQYQISQDIRFRHALLPRPEDVGVRGAFITPGNLNYTVRYPEMEAVVASFQHLESCRATHPEDVPLVRSEVIRYFNLRDMTPFGRFLTGVAKFFEMSVMVVPVEGNDLAPAECRPYFDMPTWRRLPMNDGDTLSTLAVPESAFDGIVKGFVPLIRLKMPGIRDGEKFLRRYYDAPNWQTYVVPAAATIRWGVGDERNAFPTLDHVIHTALEALGGLAVGSDAGGSDCFYLRVDE